MTSGRDARGTARARWALAVVAACASILGGASGAHADDPTRQWRTVESAHFVVHFEASLEDLARRVAVVAERAHAVLAGPLAVTPATKTQVVLLDDVDGANGFAGVLPRNAITLFATAPAGTSNLSDHDDWMYTLVAHEYTHILHLDAIHGLPKLYNAVFGKIWSPNQIMPRWLIEGLATYQESKRSSGGRTRSSQFDMYLRVPTLQGDSLRLDEVTGSPRDFPRGNAAYLYGSHFLRYVFDRFGDDTFRAMIHQSGKHPVPFAVNRQIARVVGQPFTTLYEAWGQHRADRYGLEAEAVARRGDDGAQALTQHGETNVAPLYAVDGQTLWWLESDGLRAGTIRARDRVTGQVRPVVEIDALGGFTQAPDGRLVYEQSHSFRNDYQFQDLAQWDPQTQRHERLTVGARARDPAVSPDGAEIAFSMNARAQSTLAVMPRQAGATPVELWRSPGRYDQVYQPAYSPDGQEIAISVWRAGGLRDVLRIERATGIAHEVTRDRALDGSPTYSPDGKWLFFDSDRSGISNIYALDRATGAVWQVTNVIGGAFEPAVDPTSTRLAFHAFTGKGNDLYEVAIDPGRWWPAAPYLDDRPPAVAIPDDEAALSATRPYRALETLAPQTWSAQVALGTLTSGFSLSTDGRDIVGRHAYSLAATLDFDRGDVDVGLGYAYAGFGPDVRVSANRTVSTRAGYRIDGQNRPYVEEAFGATLAVSPPSGNDPGRSWSISGDFDFDYVRMVESPFDGLDPSDRVPRPPNTNYVQNGIALRASLGNARGFLYSTGPVEGGDLGVSIRYDDPLIGARFRALSLSWTARWFGRLPGLARSGVMARYAGGLRAGDLSRSNAFGLGGATNQDVANAILYSQRVSNTGILRGFPDRVVDGAQFHLLNLEARYELWNPERGLATLPVYFKRLHVAGLLDAGLATDGTPGLDDGRISLGGALRLDALFGYFVGGSFELGAARGLGADGQTDVWFLLTNSI